MRNPNGPEARARRPTGLRVTVCNAEGLRPEGYNGASGAYVTLRVGADGPVSKTTHFRNSPAPKWDEDFELAIPEGSYARLDAWHLAHGAENSGPILFVEVRDDPTVSQRAEEMSHMLLGTMRVPLLSLEDDPVHHHMYSLHHAETSARLTLMLELVLPDLPPSAAAADTDAETGKAVEHGPTTGDSNDNAHDNAHDNNNANAHDNNNANANANAYAYANANTDTADTDDAAPRPLGEIRGRAQTLAKNFDGEGKDGRHAALWREAPVDAVIHAPEPEAPEEVHLHCPHGLKCSPLRLGRCEHGDHKGKLLLADGRVEAFDAKNPEHAESVKAHALEAVLHEAKGHRAVSANSKHGSAASKREHSAGGSGFAAAFHIAAAALPDVDHSQHRERLDKGLDVPATFAHGLAQFEHIEHTDNAEAMGYVAPADAGSVVSGVTAGTGAGTTVESDKLASEHDSDRGFVYDGTAAQPQPQPRARRGSRRASLLKASGGSVLTHTGEWDKAVYTAGLLQPGTGIWSCCGLAENYSVTCPSLEQRMSWGEKTRLAAQITARDLARREDAKLARKQWDRARELDRNPDLAAKPVEVRGFFQREITRGAPPKEAPPAPPKLTNVPTIVRTMTKNPESEWMQLEGLSALSRLCRWASGRQAMLRHGGLRAIFNATNRFSTSPALRKHATDVVAALSSDVNCRSAVLAERQLTDYVASELDLVLEERKEEYDAAHLLALGGGSYADAAESAAIKDMALEQTIGLFEILAVIASGAAGAERLVDIGAVEDVIRAINRWPAEERLMSRALAVLEQLSTLPRGARAAVGEGSVEVCLAAAEAFPSCEPVLAAALGCLVVSGSDAVGASKLFDKAVIASVMVCMKKLAAHPVLQHRALRMIQQLAGHPEGKRLLDEAGGAWQWLGQGGLDGNKLIHLTEGKYHEVGWCLAETAHTALDIKPIQEPGTQGKAWSSQMLREYMGKGKSRQAADIVAQQQRYFAIVTSVGLLPFAGEPVDGWFSRVRRFESSAGVDLTEMSKKKR